jgi:hypothetical protein
MARKIYIAGHPARVKKLKPTVSNPDKYYLIDSKRVGGTQRIGENNALYFQIKKQYKKAKKSRQPYPFDLPQKGKRIDVKKLLASYK